MFECVSDYVRADQLGAVFSPVMKTFRRLILQRRLPITLVTMLSHGL